MEVGAGFVLAVLLAHPQVGQEPGPQDEPPPKPILEVPPDASEGPRPEFPAGDGFSLKALAIRPRWELTTREYDLGMFNGGMNFGDVADFHRTTAAFEARFDAVSWMFSATALRQHSRRALDDDIMFEQHLFPAGAVVKSVAFFGSFEAYHRFELSGGSRESFQVSLLLGLNFSKFLMLMRDDLRLASEGFSALWPLPAAGVEARVSLSERLSVALSARGTRFRFDNPYQLDGGGSQYIRFLFGRFDGGVEWTISEHFTVSAGYTGLDAYIDAASAEDRDTVNLKAGGIYFGAGLRF